MRGIHLVKNLILVGAVFFGIQESSASNVEDIVCPTVDQLKQYKLIFTDAGGYDQNSQRMSFSAVLNPGGNESDRGWSLGIDSMQAEKGEDLNAILTSTIGKLEPVSSDPFQFIETIWEKEKTPVCVYTVPGNENINALAIYQPEFSVYLKKKIIIDQYRAHQRHK